jgi:hypothetical protein
MPFLVVQASGFAVAGPPGHLLQVMSDMAMCGRDDRTTNATHVN